MRREEKKEVGGGEKKERAGNVKKGREGEKRGRGKKK